MGLLEQIISFENMERAMKAVVRNKGSSGIDKESVERFKERFYSEYESIASEIARGKYKPQPVRRVEIPKDNGKTRGLGIPTVQDRVVQQAISQVLSDIYEPVFSFYSYGFRPRRGAHCALRKCVEYANQGYVHVVDMDLEKFFDTVNKSKLVQVLSERIDDDRVISLIHKFLNAGIMDKGCFVEQKAGVPQGGPLSPLLANILLDKCDKELERRGHRFVRYADDMMIFCGSQWAAERVLSSITRFLTQKLFLKVNQEKTKVDDITEVTFLGYGFYYQPRIGEIRLRVSEKSYVKLKEKLRTITCRSSGMGFDRLKSSLNHLIRGWVQYFKLADMKSRLGSIDGWLRRRIRMLHWKWWKTTRNRCSELEKGGLNHEDAYRCANSRKGYWRNSQTPMMNKVLSNRRLAYEGYETLTGVFLRLN